jgi:ankyrin repeat protein
MKVLFDYGATLTLKTNEGQTPLHLAAMWGHLDVVKWLCDNKVNLNITDNSEMTAYDLALKYKHKETANYLAKKMGKPGDL